MVTRLFILFIAFSLSACGNGKINVDDLEVTIPKDISIERIQFKTLNTEARKALNAESPDALIAVFDDNGITVYGAPDKTFKFVSKEVPNRESSKTLTADRKEPVTDVVIKTFVNSPGCHLFLNDVGGGFWYPSDC